MGATPGKNDPPPVERSETLPASPTPTREHLTAKEVAWLAALVDATDDAAIIAKDDNGTILAWNAAAEQLFGYTSTEAVGRPIAMLVAPELWDEFEQIMERVGRGERIKGLETVRLRKDGSRVQVALMQSPIKISNRVCGKLIIARDLSERNRREAEIAMSRSKMRAILDTAVDAIITINGRGLIQTINPATEQLFGYTAAELIGQNVKILMPPPYREQHDGYLSRYSQTGEKRIIGTGREVQVRRKDGTAFPIDFSVSEVEPGVLFTGIIRDVSERKRMDAEISNTAAALARLDNLGARLWETPGLKQGVEEMLHATAALLGADRGNIQLLEGGVLRIVAHQGFAAPFLNFFREVTAEDDSASGRALRLGEPVVIEDVEADAPYAPLRAVAREAGYRGVVSAPMLGRQGHALGMVSVYFASPHRPSDLDLRLLRLYVRKTSNFIERCRAEEAVRESEARLRAVVETAVDAIITIDGRGLIQTINPATERMFGYAASELFGQNVKILMPPPYHDEHDGYLARYKQTGEKRIIGIGREVQARRKDGTVFPIDLAVSEVEPGTLFTGIIRDLSERKIMEANLLNADRMAMVGTVAGGVGHDINNLLQLLRMDTDALSACSLSRDGDAAVQSLRDITKALRDLVLGLRMVGLDPENSGDGRSQTTCLTDWWPATEALLKTVSQPEVSVELRIPPGLPDVQIAPHQLTQVVFILVCNAANAIVDAPPPGGGAVRVSAEPRPAKHGVRLTVADNGRAMSPEDLSRAFEPHFTTVARRGCTVLGLALVHRMVTQAGGEVSIQSQPGTGTTVTVDLCAAPVVAVMPETATDARSAVVTIADARAAALVRRELASLGTPVRSDNDPSRARVWVVDPTTTDVNEARRWLAERPQERRLVLFGGPPQGPAPAWEALQPLVIEKPDDFEGLRVTIARAVTGGLP